MTQTRPLNKRPLFCYNKSMKLLAFNWKLNPQDYKLAEQLLAVYLKLAQKSKSQVIVCPPFEFLFSLLNSKFSIRNSGVTFGSQDCFWENLGPYTGEISALGVKQLGVDYVIVGHSERRLHLKETDEMINKKIFNAIQSGLKPILCIGEDQKIHGAGEKQAKVFLRKQLKACLKNFSSLSLAQKNQLIVAYEPIWAISNNSGNVADNPSDASAMIKFIKDELVSCFMLQAPRVLYGGSVNSKNLVGFLSHGLIDGFLIGRASLDREEVKKTIELSGHFD